MTKFSLALGLSVPTTVLIDLLRSVYSDWEFAKWIGILVVVDTVLGFAKALVHKTVSSEEFGSRFCKKMLVYISLMILSNVLFSVTVHGSTIGVTRWLSEYLCIFIIIRETISILENVNAILPIVPAWLLAYLKDFNENGKFIETPKRDDAVSA